MTTTLSMPVGALVRERPARAMVLDRYQVDYCCGGARSLQEACAAAGADAAVVAAALAAFDATPEAAAEPDLGTWSVEELLDHILETHHVYLKSELDPLGDLVEKVARRHGAAHPELLEVATVYFGLAEELAMHLRKEEEILFPTIRALATGATPVGPCGVEGPIQVMEREHEEAGAAMARLRELTAGYAVPDEACNSWRAMLARLEAFEADTHRHIHKENNVLHPQALSLAGVAGSDGVTAGSSA